MTDPLDNPTPNETDPLYESQRDNGPDPDAAPKSPDSDPGSAGEGGLGTASDDEFHSASAELPAATDDDGAPVDLAEGVVDDRDG